MRYYNRTYYYTFAKAGFPDGAAPAAYTSLLDAHRLHTRKGRGGALLYKETSGINAKILIGMGGDGLQSK